MCKWTSLLWAFIIIIMNKKTLIILLSGGLLVALLFLWASVRNASVIELKSDDGNVTLSIPRGALPQGVRAEDIKITSIGYDAISMKPREQDFLTAYEFQPDGLQFSKPVNVSFVLKNFEGTSVPTVDIISKGEIIPLESQQVDRDEGNKTLAITGAMRHFSQAVVRKHFYAVTVTGPEDHFIGDTFDVEVTHTIERRTYISTDDEFITRTLTLLGNPFVSGKITAWVHAIPEKAYPEISEAVSPKYTNDFPRITMIPETGELKTAVRFTCVKPGAVEFRYESNIDAEYEFHQVPKPQSPAQSGGIPGYEEIRSKNKLHDYVEFVLTPFRCKDQATPSPSPALQVGEPSQATVQVISYGGKQIPLVQLQVENETGCGESHYHALGGFVTATDGTKLHDPGPLCGYGKVSERPTITVPRTGNETSVNPPPTTSVTSKPTGASMTVCGLPGGPACPKK